jgi:carboxyl-terminal processing protease
MSNKNMHKKFALAKFRAVVLLLTLALLSGFIGFSLGTKKQIQTPKTEVDLSLFWQVWSMIEAKHIDHQSIDSQQMVNGAISGMVSSLGDPYTVYFPPEENKVKDENLEGEFGGVGIRLGYKDGILAVVSPLDGTPAQKAGIKAGDLILGVRDEKKDINIDTQGISLPEAVQLIRGPEGSSITLTLAREGGDHFDKEIVREKISIPSLENQWFEYGDKQIAYVHLLQFSDVMYQQWENWVDQVVARLGEGSLSGVILDLRNNPGGYLQGAVYIASEFIDNGVVVEQEYSSGKKDIFRVNRQGRLLSVPLVILVNEGSASAAEILAGALQYYSRGELIGKTTFGKGTVQEPESLPGGAGLHITISRWLLPGDKSIDKVGITPDIEIDDNNEETDFALEKAKEKVLEF